MHETALDRVPAGSAKRVPIPGFCYTAQENYFNSLDSCTARRASEEIGNGNITGPANRVASRMVSRRSDALTALQSQSRQERPFPGPFLLSLLVGGDDGPHREPTKHGFQITAFSNTGSSFDHVEGGVRHSALASRVCTGERFRVDRGWRRLVGGLRRRLGCGTARAPTG